VTITQPRLPESFQIAPTIATPTRATVGAARMRRAVSTMTFLVRPRWTSEI
jgi:hypothetical protein